MPSNPMQIPQMRQPFRRPLNPVRFPEHAGLFVDVDGTEAEFARFQAYFGPRESWLNQGGMAIAVGGEQTGKSSLLNRCASWLKEHVESTYDQTVKIADLSWVPVAPQQSASTRVATVCGHLVRHLLSIQALVNDSLLEAGNNPEQLLPYLAGSFPRNQLLIVILPPTDDVVVELVTYATYLRERVILLCETSFERRLADIEHQLDQAPIIPLLLKVGTLRPNDGKTFFERRKALHEGPIPDPPKDTLIDLVRVKDWSIGELQQLLYEVYEDVDQHPPPPPEVTYEYIMNYFVRNARLGRQP